MTEHLPRRRVVYMGTPDFAVPALMALHSEPSIEVVAVYTQPPRPKGRGYHLMPSPVHQKADDLHIPVYHPETLRNEAAQQALRDLHPDLIVVAAYGLILPKAVLDIPPYGCFNIHGSLLPRWRGAAPIQRSILAGDKETGITIMKMDVGLDTGDMILKSATSTEAKTSDDLYQELALLGANLITKAVHQLLDGTIVYEKQPEDGVTYAQKLNKEEGLLDWRLPADVLERQIRAFTPWPGCWFLWNDQMIKVLKAEVVKGDSASRPGVVLDKDLTIACGKDTLRLLRVQRAGKPQMDVAEFQKGAKITVGTNVMQAPFTDSTDAAI